MPRKIVPWDEVQRYHDAGHSICACAKTFNFSITAWYKAAANGKVRRTFVPPSGRRLDWALIQRYYDEGNSVHKCREHFGFSLRSWQKARRRGAIEIRPLRMGIEILLLTSKSRRSIKRRVLEEGLLSAECSRCGLTEWRGKLLSIQIDHINGIKDDHRLENLRMLCPNCHSQTDTYGRRNGNRAAACPVI